MTLETAHADGYLCYGMATLCGAVGLKAELETKGFACRLFPETITSGQYTVHFVAAKPRVAKPSRAERGCALT